ncbi:MAG TPA: class I SAM-dependent methyltransferase [Geminicoccaceae bacterium]|nr:class I SAM-dependent methyltransferase [Geminicoccaceae bacterium]
MRQGQESPAPDKGAGRQAAPMRLGLPEATELSIDRGHGRGRPEVAAGVRPMRLLRQALTEVRRNSPWQMVKTLLAVIEDQAFDWRYGVNTGGIMPLADLAIDSRHVAHGVHYAPTRVRYFRAVLRALSLPPGSVFVDLGAGKGRMLLLAAQSGCFRKVVGVEFSAELCRMAEQNIRRFEHYCAGNVTFEVVHADAADYEVQPDYNVFFMFNPFDHVVMQQVMARVAQSLQAAPRRIWLICLGLRRGCPSILAESGYKEAGRICYGSAKVSVFVNQVGGTGSRNDGQ